MNKAERFDYILKLEAGNREQRLKHDLDIAKHKNRMDTLNACASIMTSHMTIAAMSAVVGALNENI